MPFVSTRLGKIFYEIKGSGPPLVLIRGLGLWSQHWFGWDQHLSKFATVITLDPRGLGQTTVPMRPWDTVETISNDILTILHSEHISKAHILGTSFGGMIALAFGLQHPESTISLSVIASSIGRSGHSRLSHQATKFLLSAPRHGPVFFDSLADLLTAPKSSIDLRMKLAGEFRRVQSIQPFNVPVVLNQLIAALRFRRWERLEQLSPRSLFIVGSHDQFVPKGNSIFLHEKTKGSQFIEVKDAGHEPHVDQPELLTELIHKFCNSMEDFQ